MASFPVATILILCTLVSGIAAQNGVTTAMLQNGATTARGTTLVLRVAEPIGTDRGEWHRSQSALPSLRTTYRTVGQFQEVELNNVEDSDAGTYYYIAREGGSIIQGTVVVVESVVNGSWSMWTEGTVTACPVTCGGSTRTRNRTRSCDNPAPMYGGYTCPGDSESLQQEPCGTDACNEPTQRILDLSTNMVAYRGQSVTLRFVHSSTSGQAFWLKEGSGQILENDKYKLSSSGTTDFLTIENVQDSDAGTFLFSKGSASGTGRMTVENDPAQRILDLSSNMVAYRGETVTIRYEHTSGSGQTNWFKARSGPISNSDKYNMYSSGNVEYLTISNVQDSDADRYIFYKGSATQQGTLTVEDGQVVNGVWGPWSVGTVTACPVTCGGSTRTRNRTRLCNNPAPAYGGSFCSGNQENIAEEPCGTDACSGQVVNGVWGPWSVGTVTACPVTCGGSTRTRTRTRSCNNPAPANGGSFCSGNQENIAEEPCGTDACSGQVVNGVWGPWSVGTVTACPVTCGGSTRTRTRTRSCNNPAPANGGSFCSGNQENIAEEPCGTDACSEPPQRIQDLTNNPVAYRGQSVTLRVEHTSTSGQAIWVKIGSAPISNNAKYSMSSTGTTDFLAINDVQDSDAGNYLFMKGSANVQGTLAVEDAPPEGICAGATQKNGVGYRYHPTECDKYIQCFYSTDGQVLANYRTCPFGHYWSMMTFRCDEYWKVDNCPVEKCNSSCGVTIKAAGSCGAYWDCSVMGPRPVCCPPGYGFFRGRGCLPTLSSGEDTCPSFYACRDSCQKRPVWTNSNNYEILAGSQGWVEMECEDGMYFDIGDCGCIKRDVPCDSVRSFNFNTNNFGGDVEATSVASDGNSIGFNDNSRFSINVRNIQTGSPRIVLFRYQHTGGTSELLSMTNTQGHQTVAIYSGEDGLHFKFTAWTNCEEELMISTKGMAASDWKVVTLWYDGRHMTAIVTSGQIKNRARIYAPNIVFLDNRIHLGTSDSVKSASYTANMMETVPFNGRFDYVMIDVCDGGLLV